MSDYLKNIKIFENKLASCYVYWLKSGGIEKKHYHHALEIEYVLKGNCKTHKQGKLYLYKKGQVHEVINDSNHQLIFNGLLKGMTLSGIILSINLTNNFTIIRVGAII